ncbi:TM2 domain-containing protein [Okibacterium endophyticum]
MTDPKHPEGTQDPNQPAESQAQFQGTSVPPPPVPPAYGQESQFPPAPPYGQPSPEQGNQQPQPGYEQYPQNDYAQQGYQQAPPPGYGQQPYGYQPYGYQQPYDPNAKSRLAAGLFGIFLGAFGVHRFYLGYVGIGVAQVLITVLSLGMLSFVSAIWGLVEGIMILARTQNFNTDATGRPLRD